MKTSPNNVCVILGPANDRRCFDLFNWLRKEHPDWIFALTTDKLSLLERLMYPKALALPKNPEDLLQHIRPLQQMRYLYLPFYEDDITSLLLQKESWPAHFRLLLPEMEDFLRAQNKTLFTQFFRGQNLVARGYEAAELEEHFPPNGIVTKPALGRGAIGMRFFSDKASLGKLYPDDVIQEKLGNGHSVIGAFFFCSEGEVKVHYQHRRLRTYPSTGGVSVQAELTHIPQIAEKGASILKALHWNGLAMLEFLPHPVTGEYLAIECNTRLWGSCLLGEFSGHAPVEAYLFACLEEKAIPRKINPKAQLIWYFPYQLLYVLKNPICRLPELFLGKDTASISATRAGWFRGLLFITGNVLNRHKWEILWKKITKSR